MLQGTINALIAFLVWIVFFHSSSCNAFVLGVQVFHSPQTPSKINNFGIKSNKSFNNETVSSFQLVVASVATKFLKGSTSNSPAFEQLPVPNDHSTAFKQLSVSNDGRAITALSFLHLHIPFRMATHTNHSSVLNPVTHATSLFLLRDKDNSEITAPSLLLPFDQDNSAIMTATHASLLLPFNQDKSAIMTATHAQNLLLYAQIGSAITTVTHAQNLLLFFVQNNPANAKLHLIVAFI
jgi:hypothetical protein